MAKPKKDRRALARGQIWVSTGAGQFRELLWVTDERVIYTGGGDRSRECLVKTFRRWARERRAQIANDGRPNNRGGYGR